MFIAFMVLSLASLPGIKPTWSTVSSLGSRGSRRFVRILAYSFTFTLSREIGRSLETIVVSLPGFGINVMWVSRMSLLARGEEARLLNALTKWGIRVSGKAL